MLVDAYHGTPASPTIVIPHGRKDAGDGVAPAPRYASRFLSEIAPQRLEELYQQAYAAGDYASALVYFERLAEGRHRELASRPEFDPSRPSIITSFQPKSGGTFLHNRLLDVGYQEFWWGLPENHCHTYVHATDRTLELYLRGGAACHTHFRPSASLLSAFDRVGVKRVWIHLRNPVETAISAFHHYRGEGHGGGAIGEWRRRQALDTARAFSFLARSSRSHFTRKCLGWLTEWIRLWLQFDQDHPGLVVISYHQELADLQGMMRRVLAEFGVAAPDSINSAPTDNDRFRQNPQRNWRDSLNASTRRFAEERIRSSLGEFAAFERLWT